jgi:hypothetical protein
MYDRAGSISETQGKNLVDKAEIFINNLEINTSAYYASSLLPAVAWSIKTT